MSSLFHLVFWRLLLLATSFSGASRQLAETSDPRANKINRRFSEMTHNWNDGRRLASVSDCNSSTGDSRRERESTHMSRDRSQIGYPDHQCSNKFRRRLNTTNTQLRVGSPKAFVSRPYTPASLSDRPWSSTRLSPQLPPPNLGRHPPSPPSSADSLPPQENHHSWAAESKTRLSSGSVSADEQALHLRIIELQRKCDAQDQEVAILRKADQDMVTNLEFSQQNTATAVKENKALRDRLSALELARKDLEAKNEVLQAKIDWGKEEMVHLNAAAMERRVCARCLRDEAAASDDGLSVRSSDAMSELSASAAALTLPLRGVTLQQRELAVRLREQAVHDKESRLAGTLKKLQLQLKLSRENEVVANDQVKRLQDQIDTITGLKWKVKPGETVLRRGKEEGLYCAAFERDVFWNILNRIVPFVYACKDDIMNFWDHYPDYCTYFKQALEDAKDLRELITRQYGNNRDNLKKLEKHLVEEKEKHDLAMGKGEICKCTMCRNNDS